VKESSLVVNTQGAVAGGPLVCGQPGTYTEFELSLGYIMKSYPAKRKFKRTKKKWK
jgi:hypothetical protein